MRQRLQLTTVEKYTSPSKMFMWSHYSIIKSNHHHHHYHSAAEHAISTAKFLQEQRSEASKTMHLQSLIVATLEQETK